MCFRKVLVATLQTLVAFLALAPFLLSQTPPKPPKSVRLYVFDNGVIKGLDPATFHFKKEELATTDMVVCSYLIVHPKGTLMWDSGAIPDADLKADGSLVTEERFTATKTLKSQLAAVGYTPKDITYFGLSHYHVDHIANANDFAGSTWLVQQPEREAMFAEKGGAPVAQRAKYIALKDSKTKILNGQDYDVFRRRHRGHQACIRTHARASGGVSQARQDWADSAGRRSVSLSRRTQHGQNPDV